MKSAWFYLGGLVLLLISGFAVKNLRSQSPPVAPKGMLVTMVETRYQGELPTYTEHVVRAVGSRGSAQVVRRQDPTGNWVELKTIVDFAARKRIAIDPITESVTSYSITERELRYLASPNPDCQDPSNAEQGKRNGQDVVAWRMSIPKAKQELEVWLAPHLNCFALEETIRSNGKVVTKRESLFLIPGEPPDYLFQIPPNYTERSPAQVFAEFARRFPGRKAAPSETSSKLDDVYRSRQP